VTEIPDHLLRRSKERRAALGGEGGGEADGENAEAEAAPAQAAPAAAAAAAAPVPATVAASAAAPAVIDEAPSPIMLADQAVRRSRIPIWAVPVLVVLPFWAILYAGAFGERGNEGPVDPLVLGQQVYSTSCASCHGANGEGGVGPALKDGDAKITFPNEADHVTWVKEGSVSKAKGTPYGDPARAGGQRTVQVAGMPSFAGSLTPAQIDAVVQYEREKL
jgi:mono/diheme cytochrome c family protein